MKHSEGSWKAEQLNGTPIKWQVDCNNDFCIAIMSSINSEANARLIAAAPRLLEAANKMIIVTHKDDVEAARLELIAAVNEAEGFIDDSEERIERTGRGPGNQPANF